MRTPVVQFKSDAQHIAADLRHRKIIQTAMRNYEAARDRRKSQFQDWQAARELAHRTKSDAIGRLDKHLQSFVSKLEARGTKVYWASTSAEACEIILGILRAKNARIIVKSKTMTSEEIRLNEAMEQAGYTVVESDLGEFIVQLRQEAPYHFVFPAMHLTRGAIRETFEKELHDAPSEDPEELTMVARRVMREKFLQADVGITGANFAVAETGMISITENEGNARLTAALPRTMISLLGIEKVLPRLADLALFLPMLAVMGTGQAMTCYNTLYGGPRLAGESDGPEEFHVVLLDNRRTTLLADPRMRSALHCIRCGACLNVCPIFKNVGGHTYATTYAGPIGAVITPHLRNAAEWKHLSDASSLCGACTETCPVKIDLHHHLLQNRQMAASVNPSLLQKLAFQGYARLATSQVLWSFATRVARLVQTLLLPAKGTALDPAQAWTRTRDLPPVAKQSFREWWKKHQ